MKINNDKKTLKSINKMKQGHGKFIADLSFPNNNLFSLLIQLKNHKSDILNIKKDGNNLGKNKKNKIMNTIKGQ